jgi:hypothetical protein
VCAAHPPNIITAPKIAPDIPQAKTPKLKQTSVAKVAAVPARVWVSTQAQLSENRV